MRIPATVGLMATAIVYSSPAAAQDSVDLEVYGTLLPFVENIGTTGATPVGTETQANQVPASFFTGINHERRFRMTSGTSHLGFRGEWAVSDPIRLIWQVESPAPIDGEGPSNWANRNSHVGFTGPWGTLIYGNWDTPMRWVTVTSVNPIKGGYTGDMTPIIGSPGHSTPAWNSDQTFLALLETPPNRAGFFRHEANSIQYWTPDLAGFSARVMFAVNEHRTAGIPNTEQGLNPYLLSGYVGYDNKWLRVRYAAELHNDYFGMANMGGATPSLQNPSSSDVGHLGLVSVTLNPDTDYKTRLVVTGDYLSYHTDTNVPEGGFITDYSRAAVYGLIHQTVGANHVWAAYGKATEGSCTVSGGFPCATTGLGASYYSLGYMYEFAKDSGVYALGYALVNDVSARYTPFPLLDSRAHTQSNLPNIGEIAPGSDSLGVGIGFVYRFSVKVLGEEKKTPAAPKDKEAPATTEAEAATDEAEPPAPADKKKDAAGGENVELEEEEPGEGAPPAP